MYLILSIVHKNADQIFPGRVNICELPIFQIPCFQIKGINDRYIKHMQITLLITDRVLKFKSTGNLN